MPIPFTCPHCGAQTNVSEQYAGQSGPCANCGQTIAIPGPVPGTYPAPVRRSSGSGWIIVLVIVGVVFLMLIMVAVGLALFGRAAVQTQDRANIAQAEVQIAMYESAVQMYQIDVGEYPSTMQGLDALVTAPSNLLRPDDWHGPYATEPISLDPWGNPYQYEYPGPNSVDRPDIYSMGPDGEAYTDDDVGNWMR